jgi:flagellar motor switch protein FliM
MNTQFANIATPNEVVVTTTFRIELGPIGGDLHICIPYSMVEPIRDLLRSSMHSESINHDNRWGHLLKQQIQSAEVETIANLCSTNSTLRDILNMKVGDIIPIDMPDTVELNVDNIPIMECSYGKFNGQYALRVENLFNNSDYLAQGVTHE